MSDRIIVLKLKGKHFNNTIIQVYAPTCTCSSEEIEQFYENLATAKNQCGSLDVRMVMGDLNAKVGRKQAEDDGVVSPLGLGERNERGEQWVSSGVSKLFTQRPTFEKNLKPRAALIARAKKDQHVLRCFIFH